MTVHFNVTKLVLLHSMFLYLEKLNLSTCEVMGSNSKKVNPCEETSSSKSVRNLEKH